MYNRHEKCLNILLPSCNKRWNKCQYFSQFMSEGLYDKMYDYLIKLSRGNDKAIAHIKK